MELSTSKADTEILNVDKEHGEEVSHRVALEERNIELDEGQAGSDPGKTPESRPPPEEDQAGSDPRQNLEDAFTFGDQFINDKSTKEEPRKANVETEVESMVIVPIHQASSSVPPLSTPIIDLTPPKPILPPVQELIFTATTATITTLPPLPPPPQQSTTDPDLANRVTTLEKRSAEFEKKHQLKDKTTKALASRVYKLEHHNLYSKIDKQVNEVVKEAIHNSLQAPLREHFRDLSKVQMKEILHDRMFESGSYRLHPDHSTLYEALEASMQRDNNDELHAKLTRSQKRRRDDQDPPPPPSKDSGRSKKKKHDSDVSALKQPPIQKSSAWKTSNTREAPSISSKQNPASPPPVDDNPILDDMHLSESEDTSVAHLLKIKTQPDWLKPLPKEKAPETP
ncbi:hypothetical protein Tco_1553401 [Tanacetum coccineum]